jgi:hypothetical protein
MNRAPRSPDHKPATDELVGYQVESLGGPTGRIDTATRNADDRYLVVRTGRWPRQHRVVVPAGAINCVDRRQRTLWVERDRDDVRNGPTFDQSRHGRRPVDATPPLN